MGMYGLVFGICYVYISTTVVWTHILKSECGCYGTALNIINANCNSTEQIAIHRLVYGIKTIVSDCLPKTTPINIKPETANNCCTINETTDCMFDIQSESNQTYQQYIECIGKSSCTLQVTWAQAPESCAASGTYLKDSNFMCLDYYCVPTSTTDVTVKCTDSSSTCPTSPGPTSKVSEDCFLKYGLPVLVSSLVVGVAAVVAASVFWFKRGQRSALNKVSSDNSTPVTRLTDDNSVSEMERSDHPLPPFNIRYNHLPPISTHSSDV